MSEPTSKAIRKARREVRAVMRRRRGLAAIALALVGAVVGAIALGIHAGWREEWVVVVFVGVFALGGAYAAVVALMDVCESLDAVRDSLADAMDDERARLTREAERELLAFERRQGEDR